MTPDSQNPKPGFFRLVKFFSPFRLVMFVFLALILYFYYALIADIVFSQFLGGASFSSVLPLLLNVFLLLFGTWVFLQVSKFFISRHLENRGKKKEIKLILSLYSYIVWALMLVLIASTIFKDIGIFIASLGLIGFGLTLALQKPILNFVGWLTVVINKPFNVGDRIEVSGNRGDVVAIHSMYTLLQGTRLDTHEKNEKMITFPNEFILTNPVINYTKRADLFWEEINVNITYESNWKKAEKILFDVTKNVMKKYVVLPAVSASKDRKSFEDALKLLEEASKKLSKGFVKQSIKENIETMKVIEQKSGQDLPEPHVRLDFLDSGLGLNVVFLADIRKIRVMRTEIAKGFLFEVEKNSDIQIAYPHMQVVLDKKQRAVFDAKKVSDFM